MEEKKCIKCSKSKPLSDFRDGRGSCKVCEREYYKKYDRNNKEKIKEKNKRYREDNPEYFKNKHLEYKENNPDYYSTYREKNKDKRKEYNRKHREENSEHYSKYTKEYHKKNPNYTKEYHRKRRAEDPLFRLAGNIRCLTKAALRERGFTKKSKTHEILGCSYEYLKEKLEDNPYGFTVDDHTIDIDHIIPLISAKNEVELLRLCKVDNLQLLPSFYNQNIKKDKRFNREHFHAWMEKMNL